MGLLMGLHVSFPQYVIQQKGHESRNGRYDFWYWWDCSLRLRAETWST
jgi:hypothetical protein